MYRQTTNIIFMVKPVQFAKNEQTSVNNYFQTVTDKPTYNIQSQALEEFDRLVEKLKSNDVHVEVFEDTLLHKTPDSIFPNNWLTTHEDGSIFLYPMFAKNRRKERREDIINFLKQNFFVKNVHLLSNWEEKGEFLEGTGSLIIDRCHNTVYAGLSGRTHKEVLQNFCHLINYQSITFSAMQTVFNKRLPIYHTNVMMSLGENFAVICLECIDNVEERERVKFELKKANKIIIEISEKQVKGFAGNIIQIRNSKDKLLIIMSQAAFDSFTSLQIKNLEAHGTLVVSPIPTIEKYGGGSVRCMITEIFLPMSAVKN